MPRRSALWLIASLFILYFSGWMTPSSAQDDNKGEPAADVAANSPAAGQPPKVEPTKEKSYLTWMIESSGAVGVVLFLMSFATVALTVMMIWELRRKVLIPPELVSEFDRLLNEKRYQEAYEIVRTNDSFLGKVLAAGLGRISSGYEDAVEAMQETGEDEAMRIDHRLSWLAIIGTLAPLLGLLGTVEGIIAAFRVIATSETQPKPSLLANGISTSLFNTFEGLFVAIMATVAFMLLKNQAARLVLETGMTSSNLMLRFKHPSSPSA